MAGLFPFWKPPPPGLLATNLFPPVPAGLLGPPGVFPPGVPGRASPGLGGILLRLFLLAFASVLLATLIFGVSTFFLGLLNCDKSIFSPVSFGPDRF